MGLEIVSMVGQASLLQKVNNVPDLAFKKDSLHGLGSGGGLVRLGWKKGLSGLSQMLAGMKPIHDLGAVGEVVGHPVPNPSSSIAGHTTIGSLWEVMGDSQRPEGCCELLHIA